MATAQVTEAAFATEVLNSDKAVVVDFWAEWCGPCKQLAPALDEIATEMQDTVKVVKVNIDENPDAPGRYGVRAIPTLMLFKDGQLASTQVGVQPKSRLVDWIKTSV